MRMLLLNPGPVTLSDRVRAAMAREDLCHREPEYATLQREIQARLLGVYPEAEAEYAAILLAGSGTAAVEAMVGSLVLADGLALVVVNGVYGERMAAMLEAQRKPHLVWRGAWTEAPDVMAIAAMLDAHPGVTHMLAVHHETTTGRLNPLDALGALCRARGVALLLDAVSSFGAEAIAFEAWNLEAVAAGGNKCLHGVPGAAFVIARRSALESRESGATSVYLDLFRYHRAGAPFTPPVHALFALHEALAEHAEAGGWQARGERFRALSAQARRGLEALGFPLFLEDASAYSGVLTSYRLPPGVDYATLHARLKAAGFVIYAGQGPFDGRIFRLSPMGAVGPADIDRLLAEVAAIAATAPAR